jgi:hypothetical protein
LSNPFDATAKALAVALTILVGAALLAATPMLLFLGGWTGSDSGSVARGLAIFLGVPWLCFLATTFVVRAALARDRPRLALLVAIPLVLPVIWMVRIAFRVH